MTTSKNPKGFNNEDEWENLENTHFTSKSKKIDDSQYAEYEDVSSDEIEDNLNESEENFDEVLQLTQYNDESLMQADSRLVPAEFREINIETTNEKHQNQAKKLVSRITSFIINMKDVELTEQHKNYLRQVGTIEVSQLADLLYLVDINKQMLENIVRRVNATQSEDYALIASYSNIANQHLKLIKEVSNTYKSIPATLKKMKAEVLCNQEIDENKTNEDFKDAIEVTNSSKQLLKKFEEKRKERENLKDSAIEN